MSFTLCFRFNENENHYESVPDTECSQMNTMDIRIKITEEVIRESDSFSDDSLPKCKLLNNKSEKLIKSDFAIKAKTFKKKCLARISSLAVRWYYDIESLYIFDKIWWLLNDHDWCQDQNTL